MNDGGSNLSEAFLSRDADRNVEIVEDVEHLLNALLGSVGGNGGRAEPASTSEPEMAPLPWIYFGYPNQM